MDNCSIAQRLTKHARTLEETNGNLYRVRAYRRAAETILGLEQPVSQIVEEKGKKGLQALPGIGAHISVTIESLVRTGEFTTVKS